MNETTSILLVDDHEIVRDGVKLLLRKRMDFEVVGAANNGIEALELLKSLKVDILISDISMPEMDGIALTKAVKEQYPEIKILILTLLNDESTVREIAYAEAEGYVLKNTGSKELSMALDKIREGGTYYSDSILRMVLKGLHQKSTELTKHEILSKREIEVLKYVADEKTSKEISEILFLSPKTIETHRKNILRKTGQKTLVGLIKFAIVNQIVDIN